MLGGGWRSRTWGAPRATLAAQIATATTLVLVGAAPTVHAATVVPAGRVTLSGTTPISADQQPAVRWSGLTSAGRWRRTWGPHPTAVAPRSSLREIPCGALALTGLAPGRDVTLPPSVAGGPKLVWRSGLNSYIGRLVWGPTGGSINDTAKATPPMRVALTATAPGVALDTSGTDRRARVSWASFETPDASRAARVSWAVFETPDALRAARISWAELQVPDAPRAARVSWAALEVPDAPVGLARRALVSWAELQVPQPINLSAARAPTRTWVIPRESRTWVVPAQSRTWSVR